jgi:radical SAM protein with 4Fe4S-binding SPASM domain
MKEDASFHLKEIKFEVTHDCLLNCVHCSSISRPESGRSMDWPTFIRVLDEADGLGVSEIAFSGGEPLLWVNIEDAISASLSHGIRTTLYTTGNAPNAKVVMRNLQALGLDRVVFSIFGPDSRQHETITKYKGSFDRTVKIAKFCSAIGLSAEFHFVPLAWNYRMLPEIANLASQIGVKRISVLRLVPQGRGKNITDGQLNYPQNIELRKSIMDLRYKGHDIRLGSPYNFLMLRKNPQCRSGIDRMTIGPDFRIFPCDAFKHILPEDIGKSGEYSNLRDHSLKECWETSPYFQAVREYLMADMAAECKSCIKLKECNSGCMAQKFYTYGRLVIGPDPMCLSETMIN